MRPSNVIKNGNARRQLDETATRRSQCLVTLRRLTLFVGYEQLFADTVDIVERGMKERLLGAAVAQTVAPAKPVRKGKVAPAKSVGRPLPPVSDSDIEYCPVQPVSGSDIEYGTDESHSPPETSRVLKIGRRCASCKTNRSEEKDGTLKWRNGPDDVRYLCKACSQRYDRAIKAKERRQAERDAGIANSTDGDSGWGLVYPPDIRRKKENTRKKCNGCSREKALAWHKVDSHIYCGRCYPILGQPKPAQQSKKSKTGGRDVDMDQIAANKASPELKCINTSPKADGPYRKKAKMSAEVDAIAVSSKAVLPGPGNVVTIPEVSPKIEGPPALIIIGNTCYVNVILESLVVCEPLLELLARVTHDTEQYESGLFLSE